MDDRNSINWKNHYKNYNIISFLVMTSNNRNKCMKIMNKKENLDIQYRNLYINFQYVDVHFKVPWPEA